MARDRERELPWRRKESRRQRAAEAELVEVSPEPRTAEDVEIEPQGTRLGELLDNEDPQVSLAAAGELLSRIGTLPAPEPLTTLEEEEHLLKITRGPSLTKAAK